MNVPKLAVHRDNRSGDEAVTQYVIQVAGKLTELYTGNADEDQ